MPPLVRIHLSEAAVASSVREFMFWIIGGGAMEIVRACRAEREGGVMMGVGMKER